VSDGWEYLTATRGADDKWIYDPPDPRLPRTGADVEIIEAALAIGGWLLKGSGSPISFRREAVAATERLEHDDDTPVPL
jgi:hypothetical protein